MKPVKRCIFVQFIDLLLRLNLHGFEDISSFQHNVVALFNPVLRVIVSVVRHYKTDKPARRFAGS